MEMCYIPYNGILIAWHIINSDLKPWTPARRRKYSIVNQEMQMASMRAKCGLSTGLSSRSFKNDKGCKFGASDIS